MFAFVDTSFSSIACCSWRKGGESSVRLVSAGQSVLSVLAAALRRGAADGCRVVGSGYVFAEIMRIYRRSLSADPAAMGKALAAEMWGEPASGCGRRRSSDGLWAEVVAVLREARWVAARRVKL